MDIVSLANANMDSSHDTTFRPDAYGMDAAVSLASPFNDFTTHITDRSLYSAIFNSPVNPVSSAVTTAPLAALMDPAFDAASTLPAFPVLGPASYLAPELPKGHEMIDMETGEVWCITKESSGRYRTMRKLDGYIEYASERNLRHYFATVTFAPRLGLSMKERDAYRTKFLHKLRKRFRRAGLEVKYVWVFSVQLERFLAGDDAATPYHILLACAPGALPDQQPYTDAKGKDRWRTVVDGNLLTLKKLKSMWTTPDGRSLGTVNCGLVRDLRAAKNYMLLNEQQAEKHRVGKHRRFGGSRLGLLGASKSVRRKVNEELRAHPELGYNSFVRRNGTVLMRVVKDGRIVHEKAIVSSWTSDPERWLERERVREEAAMRKRSAMALSSEPVAAEAECPTGSSVARGIAPSVEPPVAPAPVSEVSQPVDILDAIMDLQHANAVRPGAWHVPGRVRPAIKPMIDSMGVFKGDFTSAFRSGSTGDVNQCPFHADASLTRSLASDDAFGGESYAADRAASSPASSPAPARSHAERASGHDAQANAQAGAPVERAHVPTRGDVEERLARYMRRLGLHLAPGDAGSGMPVGRSANAPEYALDGASVGAAMDALSDAARGEYQHTLRDMSAPGSSAQAVVPAKHAWAPARDNQEVRS